ncbi:DUF1549 domain-containing protein [Schlesneria paludicola]|uniref:DUF1549 domain-containing protein n=1 Tax=Schlesneria paludicola TaxID=360056 RepID=UPI00138ABBC7|nr:PSD1 and planctomycete cytochrome C domain-containing protein [Schlesneria paludicola]
MPSRTQSGWFVLITFIASASISWAVDDAPTVDADHAVKRAKGLEVFRSQVRDLLIQRCLACHGGDATEGKFDLATQDGLLRGGERGPAVIIGRGEKSLLARLISHQQEPHMPKDGPPFSKAEIASVIEWIELGAPYDEPLLTQSTDPTAWTRRKVDAEAKSFWSYQPLTSVTPPLVSDNDAWAQSAIDPFILKALKSASINPNGPVDRAALIRRVTFDLIGLPPSADDVHQYVEDSRPDAYERLIDRLLASPHYGERWGRRWLDLVRFAESHGFEHDYDRPSAYHYRDFVVQALNEGMPYDQFVRWQIAGDELAPQERMAQMATGYLAAGVHSTQITKNEVEKHRYDEMDDMLSTIGTSLLGLTIGCARCHDHKFDAIPQADYYRLLATFTTTIRSEVELDFDPIGYQRARADFDREHEPFLQAVRAYETSQLPTRFAEWFATRDQTAEKSMWLIPSGITFRSQGNAVFTRQPDGSWLVTGPNPAHDVWTIEFVTKSKNIQSLRLEALADASLAQSGPGRAPNGNFALTDFQVAVRPYDDSATNEPTPVSLKSVIATFEQNQLPVTATIDDDPNTGWAVDPEFGKNHAAVFSTATPIGTEQGTAVTITLQFKQNTQHSLGRVRLTISPQADLPATVGGARDEAIQSLLLRRQADWTDSERAELHNWFKPQDAGWQAVDSQRATHAASAPQPRIRKVLVATEGLPAVTLHTQAEAEFQNETYFLRRGETNQKDAIATPGFLQVLLSTSDESTRFQEQPPAGWHTSFRRTSLTNWLVDRESGAGNLFARVIVNRLWQQHLGRGIVGTPSDFGTRGERPTHPELLDWLANELVRRGWELKPLHRQILISGTYQQACDQDEARASVDRENRLFWHRPRRRLDAESIRDAILACGNRLDDRLYGPGQLDEGHRRRSLYFTMKRSQLMPSMTVFDAPDGTTPVADRPQTTIAPQALLLMNNTHVRQAAQQCATELLAQSHASLDSAIRRGYLTTIGRPPSNTEFARSLEFVRGQRDAYSRLDPTFSDRRALTDFCQILFCLNEFIYVE